MFIALFPVAKLILQEYHLLLLNLSCLFHGFIPQYWRTAVTFSDYYFLFLLFFHSVPVPEFIQTWWHHAALADLQAVIRPLSQGMRCIVYRRMQSAFAFGCFIACVRCSFMACNAIVELVLASMFLLISTSLLLRMGWIRQRMFKILYIWDTRCNKIVLKVTFLLATHLFDARIESVSFLNGDYQI